MDEVTNHLLQVFVSHNVRQKGVLSSKDLDAQPAKAAMVPSSGNHNNVVLDIMREITKTSRIAHKNDLWTMCQRQMT